MSKSTRNMKEKFSLRNAGKVVSIVAAIMYVIAVVMVINMHIVPVKYLVIGILLTAIVMAGIVMGLFMQRTRRAVVIVLLLLSLLVIGVSTYVISVSRSTSSFLEAIQQAEYTTEEYSVIAMKDRHIDLLQAKQAALLENDPYRNDVADALKTVTSATQQPYGDLTSVMIALEGSQSDIAVLNAGYMQLLRDNYADFDSKIEVLTTLHVRVQHQTNTSNASATKPFVVYISGIDTYGDIASVSRSDVNMLAVVNPVTRKLLLVNTPRDYYVQLHGTTGTRDKLTHAGIYGIDMSRQTLGDLYGVNIDYYIRVNFTSLVNIVDTLGGVDVYSDVAFKSYRVGYNHMNGKQALEFSRERYSFAAGDRQRGKDQQRVIEAIIAKMSNAQNIVRYQALLGSLQGALQTNMSSRLIEQLANKQLDDMKRWQTESISVDGAGASAPTYSMGAQPLYVMVPDQQTVDAAKTKIGNYLAQ